MKTKAHPHNARAFSAYGAPMIRYILFALPLLAAACQPKAPAAAEAPPVAAPAAAQPLVGTRWTLVRLPGQPVSTTNPPTLTFNASADPPRCAGLAGCNRFTGPYQLAAPNGLTFGALVSTKMACDAMATETRYLSALQATARYQLAGDSLVLLGQEGSTPLATLRGE